MARLAPVGLALALLALAPEVQAGRAVNVGVEAAFPAGPYLLELLYVTFRNCNWVAGHEYTYKKQRDCGRRKRYIVLPSSRPNCQWRILEGFHGCRAVRSVPRYSQGRRTHRHP